MTPDDAHSDEFQDAFVAAVAEKLDVDEEQVRITDVSMSSQDDDNAGPPTVVITYQVRLETNRRGHTFTCSTFCSPPRSCVPYYPLSSCVSRLYFPHMVLHRTLVALFLLAPRHRHHHL